MKGSRLKVQGIWLLASVIYVITYTKKYTELVMKAEG
jgi:hypothetical protein